MHLISDFATWITNNQTLFSGLAALVALATLVLRFVGKGVAHLRARGTATAATGTPGAGTGAGPAPAAAPGPADVPATPGVPTLVVLAFDNQSTDAEMQFFCDGVSEEIIQRLSRGADFKVIGRSTSFQFRGERKGEAARTLGCSHVVDGSIRRAAGKVRVSAHLDDASDRTTLWSDRYDRELQDMLRVQDDIAGQIATALRRTLAGGATEAVDPDDYDLYLRASPKSFAPDELGAGVAMLEVVTRRSPRFAAAWGRLAFLRSFLHFYRPWAERGAARARVEQEAGEALALDADNADAAVARLFVVPPFGDFVEGARRLWQLRDCQGRGDGKKYVGWYMRTLGMVASSVAAAQAAYEVDPLDPMTINQLALSHLAAGQLDLAAPLYAGLVESQPGMSFPVASLLRVYAFQQDWAGVDRLVALAEQRSLREFAEGLPFIRAKRDPTPENVAAFASTLERAAAAGAVDIARLVYAAHLGLVDQAYALAAGARLGPTCAAGDVMGPDAYRTSLLFQSNMPELRDDERFPALCARLGLVDFWMQTQQWPDCADQVPYDFRAGCERSRGAAREACGA